MMEEPAVSVIIPVYNVEDYLQRCVRSVLRQTYKHLEIFLVDDGSTDSSGALCDALAEEDRRIQVIHKPNGGLADARNAALDVMTGAYFVCVDSDDYVADDYVEYLLTLLREHDADISVCESKKVYRDTDALDDVPESVEILEKTEAIGHYLYQRKLAASAWGKMYKSGIFSDLRYPVGYYYEDMAIICRVLDKAERIVLGKKQKYYYFQRDNSIMRESFNPKKMHRIEIAESIKGFIEDNYPALLPAAETRCFLAAVQTYREVPLKDEYSRYIDIIWNEILRTRKSVLFNGKARLLHRVIALSTYPGKGFLDFLGRLYSKAN